MHLVNSAFLLSYLSVICLLFQHLLFFFFFFWTEFVQYLFVYCFWVSTSFLFLCCCFLFVCLYLLPILFELISLLAFMSVTYSIDGNYFCACNFSC